MRVLVAGCGDLGTAFGLLAAERGHGVVGLRRDASDLPSPLVPVSADLTDPSTLDALPAGIEAVVVTVSADGRDERAYRAAYLDGPANLLHFLGHRRDPVRRLLFTSSTAVYAQADGEEVDERSPTEPVRSNGRITLEAERRLQQAAVDGPRVVLRLGGIYGPGRDRLVERVRAGEEVCVAGETAYTNRIHRDDAANALVHVLELDGPDDTYLVVDDAPADRCEVLRWLAGQLGVAPPRVVPAGDGPQRRAGSKRCRNDRLRATGWAPTHPSYREGYAALLHG